MIYRYYIPTKVYFGAGSLARLQDVELPGKKALIIISKGNSMISLGYLDRVKKYLTKAGVVFDVYQGISPNPTLQEITKGGVIARQGMRDFVIGLGGGSTIDAAKSIAIMATSGGDYWDYVKGSTGKNMPLLRKPLPVVAITTTAGTGSEIDPWTVITKEKTAEKVGFGNDDTFPVLSIVDPELMLSVPPDLTAYQGFDALFHSVEGYISKWHNDISDLYALKSIELITEFLPKAIENGQDIEAREKVALANSLAGIVISIASCTSEHSLEHPLSAYHKELPHGAGLLMISLEYHKYFLDATPQRYIDMAKAMGKKDADNPNDFILCLTDLMEKCNVKDLKMSDYGIDNEDFAKYANSALETMYGAFQADNKPLPFEEIVGIYQRSYK